VQPWRGQDECRHIPATDALKLRELDPFEKALEPGKLLETTL